MELIALTFIQGRVTATVGIEDGRFSVPTLTSSRLPFPIPGHVATDLAGSEDNRGPPVIAGELVKGLVKLPVFGVGVLGGLVNEFFDG
jgi:hypothetical protein